MRPSRPMRGSLALGPLFLCLACSSAPQGSPGDDAGAPIDSASPDAPGKSDGATPPSDGGTTGNGIPSGWLYTQGASLYLSDGTTGTKWMGRGVNVDDVFFCGYNNSLWMNDPQSALATLWAHLMSEWNPSFVRISLGMNSFTVTSWTSGDPSTYKTPMTNVIDSLTGAGAYVLVTLRSDTSMTKNGSDDATCLPTNATDDTYRAIVDTFATSSHVLFGVSNEPGGNTLSNQTIRDAMDHAVSVIRAEEDKLGAPHHIVSVQGNDWTSDISFYASSPLSYDDVVYEVHGYPPPASSYTYANIPVIIGEYGDLPDANAFFADLEAKGIPNLAWDFDSYSDCTPDLLTVNQSSSNLVPTAWGSTVKAYLLQH